jgi:hypothetical protein
MWNERLATDAIKKWIADVVFQDSYNLNPNQVHIDAVPDIYLWDVLYDPDGRENPYNEDLPNSYIWRDKCNWFSIEVFVTEYTFAFFKDFCGKVNSFSFTPNEQAHFFIDQGETGFSITVKQEDVKGETVRCKECGGPWPDEEDEPPIYIDVFKGEENEVQVWYCPACESYFTRKFCNLGIL